MKVTNLAKRIASIATLKAGFLAAVTLLLTLTAVAQVEYVDPTIGNVSILLVPTRPTVYLPNSMVRVYPMREDALGRPHRVLPADHQFAPHR